MKHQESIEEQKNSISWLNHSVKCSIMNYSKNCKSFAERSMILREITLLLSFPIKCLHFDQKGSQTQYSLMLSFADFVLRYEVNLDMILILKME